MSSCTPAGLRIGIIVSTKRNSVAWALVDDSAVWSSPISASTPPCLEEPARLAWRNTSPERSTPGPLPYQTEKTPSCLPSPSKFGLLRAPAGGGRKLLVQAWLEDDIGFGELFLGTPELLVEATERRAAVAGNETRRIQSRKPIAFALHEQHADDQPASRTGICVACRDRICRRAQRREASSAILCGGRLKLGRANVGSMQQCFPAAWAGQTKSQAIQKEQCLAEVRIGGATK